MPAFKRTHFYQRWRFVLNRKIFEFSSKMIGNFTTFFQNESPKKKLPWARMDPPSQQCILSKLDAGFQTSSFGERFEGLISQSKDLHLSFHPNDGNFTTFFWTNPAKKSYHRREHQPWSVYPFCKLDAVFQTSSLCKDLRFDQPIERSPRSFSSKMIGKISPHFWTESRKKVTIGENTNRNSVSLANSMPAFKRAHFAKIWDLIS